MKNLRFRRTAASIAVLSIVAVIIAATVGRPWIEDLVAEPAPTAQPAVVESTLSPEEQSFYDAVVPRMLVVDAEAKVLAEMGREHSRNLLELQARRDRVNENTNFIEAYVERRGVPTRFGSAYEEFSRGVELLRRAMTDSRQGMVAFNWDKVAEAIEVFEDGSAAVSAATIQIQRAVASPTPGPA